MSNKENIPMRELEKISGFSRATINFYIKEKLLPSPEKSAKNMAYYSEMFVTKLKLIKKLKDADLSLAQMKEYLSEENTSININPLLDTIRSVNQLLPFSSNGQPVSIQQIEELEIDHKTIEKLIDLSVIVPLDKEKTLFPSYSITVCRLAKYFLDFGVPMLIIKKYMETMHELINIEYKAFDKYINNTEYRESENNNIELLHECTDNINTLLPLLHIQLIESKIKNEQQNTL